MMNGASSSFKCYLFPCQLAICAHRPDVWFLTSHLARMSQRKAPSFVKWADIDVTKTHFLGIRAISSSSVSSELRYLVFKLI